MLFPKMASATPDTPPASDFEINIPLQYSPFGGGVWVVNPEMLSGSDALKMKVVAFQFYYSISGFGPYGPGFTAFSVAQTQGDLYINDVFVGTFSYADPDPNAGQDPPVTNYQDFVWVLGNPTISLSLPTDGVTPVNIKIKNFSIISKPGNLKTYTTGSPRDNVPMDLSASSAVTLWFLFSRSSTQSGDWKIAFEHGTGSYGGSNQGFIFEINDEDTGSDSTYMSVVSIPPGGWGSSYNAKFDIGILPVDTLCSVALRIVRDDTGETRITMWVNGVQFDPISFGSAVYQGNTKFLNSNLYRMARSNGNFPANGVLSDVLFWNDLLDDVVCTALSARGTITDF